MDQTVVIVSSVAVFAGGLVMYRKHIQSVVGAASTNANVNAFLKAIRVSEDYEKSDAERYNTVYGGGTFINMTDHPAITGEWTGKALTAQQCYGAGLTPPCKSTAAGAYQFTKPTWQWIKLRIGVTGFGKTDQDLGAIDELRFHNALDDVIAGNIQQAIQKLDGVWASLPGSQYGQPTAELNDWLDEYKNAGGFIA